MNPFKVFLLVLLATLVSAVTFANAPQDNLTPTTNKTQLLTSIEDLAASVIVKPASLGCGYQECTFDSDCCEGDCRFGKCGKFGGCGYGECTFDSDCCDGECRFGKCGKFGGCGYGECTFDSDCCSGNCRFGKCSK